MGLNIGKRSFEGVITARHRVCSISFHVVENLTQGLALKVTQAVSFRRIEGLWRRAHAGVAVCDIADRLFVYRRLTYLAEVDSLDKAMLQEVIN